MNKFNLNYKKENINKGREYYLGLVFTILPAAIFALILMNKTMPPAEGWYSYYAQLINSGKVVYRDFEYLFMPAYITFIALFTKIFGYSIIALRFLGVIFFSIISYLAYKIFDELFSPVAACFAAVTTVFYLQSEVVQIFYDYIRFMDIFAYLAIYLLIKMSKQFIGGSNKKYLITLFAGVANAMVLMTKQNIGLLFGFYVFCFFIFLLLYIKDKKNVIFNLLFYGAGAGIVFAVYGLYLLIHGALKQCLNQTLFGAVGAKGGVQTILFKWIINGIEQFDKEKIYTIGILIIALVLIILDETFHKTGSEIKNEKKVRTIILCIFGALFTLSVIGLYVAARVSRTITKYYTPITYGFFLLIAEFFFLMIIAYLIDIFSKKKRFTNYIGFFMLLGSIFAIGYGVGMSGGLAASQIALSTGFIVAMLFSLCQHRFSFISMSLVGIIALGVVVFCGAYKMVYPYEWWGLAESQIWDAKEETDVPILKGIKVTKEEKELYESVYEYTNKYTSKNDSIFCFPHIPIMYTISNRYDPGTFSKVQWYDVSTDETVKNDISIVEKASPKVIIIYNIPKSAIKGHEETFNNGKESSTTTMYKSLKQYVLSNSYTSKAYYKSGKKSSITVWVKEDNPKKWYSSGSGTKFDPFVISDTEQFLNFAEMVNNGATFDNSYVKLGNDIDLSQIENFEPIGSEKNSAAFNGVFDGDGHIIKNLSIINNLPSEKSLSKYSKKEKAEIYKSLNASLFGNMNGQVINLCVENSTLSGFCAAGIVRNCDSKSALIVNCLVKNCNITGLRRAGAVADDFTGKVYNCVAYNTNLDADKTIGMTSYRTAGIYQEECFTNIKYYNDLINYYSSSYMNSQDFADELNVNAKAYVHIINTEKRKAIGLSKWIIKDGEIKLSNKKYLND